LLAAACVFIFIYANGSLNPTQVRPPSPHSDCALHARRRRAPLRAPPSSPLSAQTFLTVYMGCFAFLLFFFETRFACTETLIRRNFGFMFTYMGRTIFLIFLSAVCFGMLSPNQTDTPY